MFVVVHPSERVVVEYVCNNRSLDDPYTVKRTVVQQRGNVYWHVVGGVAPYMVIDKETLGTNVCITVVDAAGTMATGCATRRASTQTIYIECPKPMAPAVIAYERQQAEEQAEERAEAREDEFARPKSLTPKDNAGRARLNRRVEYKGGGGSPTSRLSMAPRPVMLKGRSGGGGAGRGATRGAVLKR